MRYGLRPDRADVIVPAAEIILCLAKVFSLACVVAPGVGLREGVLSELVASRKRREAPTETV